MHGFWKRQFWRKVQWNKCQEVLVLVLLKVTNQQWGMGKHVSPFLGPFLHQSSCGIRSWHFSTGQSWFRFIPTPQHLGTQQKLSESVLSQFLCVCVREIGVYRYTCTGYLADKLRGPSSSASLVLRFPTHWVSDDYPLPFLRRQRRDCYHKLFFHFDSN